eukprot:COSAG01_NODE_25392_length_746_cov_3.520866_1_plen_67_part_01
MVTAHPAIMQQGYSRTLLPVQLYLRARTVLRETVLKYSSYWSTASPQLHGPKAKPDSASKLKALRGV